MCEQLPQVLIMFYKKKHVDSLKISKTLPRIQLRHLHAIICPFPLSRFRAIIELLPCTGKGIMIQLRGARQICSVHMHGIPV